jgi:hypothetical protein
MVTADFNNDGLGDIVIGASGQDPYENGKPVGPTPGEPSYVLMSAPSGYKSLKIPDIPSIFAHHVSLGDINADGFQDVFIDSIGFGSPSDFKRPFSYFLVGQPGGLFSVDRSRLPDMIRDAAFITVSPLADGKTIFNTNTYTSSVIFDCNGDGFKDLAVLPIGGTQQGMVFLNDGTGNFSDERKVILPPGPYGSGYLAAFTDGRQETFGSLYLDTKAIDINQDGRLDLVSIVTKDSRGGSNYEFYRGAAVQVLVNTPHGFVDETSSRVSFTHTPDTNYSHYDTVEVTDFNADGFSDVVIYRGFSAPDGASNTRILLNDGTGIFTDTPFPKGIPKGLLICVDPTVGRYVLISQAGTSYAADGSPNYMIRVDGVDFDWSKGLDLFTGEARPSGKQLSDIPGRWLHGASGNDELVLSKGHERGFGYDGNDSFRGLEGSDSLDGGDGIDTAIFEKSRSAYKTEKLIQDNTTLWKVTDLATGDVDELRNIEKLEFAKASVAGYQNLVQTEVNLDVTGTPAVTYRLYKAAFARDPDLGGLGYWISALEQYLNPNLSPEKNPFLLDVAKTFVESKEFKDKYGADVDNATYIRNLYKNALGRDPLIPDPVTGKTDAGYTYWVGVLDAKAASRSDLFVYFSESTENKAAVAPIIATGVEYVPWAPPGG